METFFKKYLNLVFLALLAVAAALFAAGANRLLASAVLIPTPVPLVVEKTKEIKVAREHRGASILTRNIFDSSSNPAPPPEELAESEGSEEMIDWTAENFELGDDVPVSDLPVQVTGTIVSSISSSSNASIKDGAETKLYQEGEEIREATILAIRRKNVFILRNNRPERLPLLSDEERAAAPPPKAPGIGAAPPVNRPGPAVAQANPADGAKDPLAAVRDGVKKTGQEEYEIDRGMLEEQLQDLSKLSSMARVIPHYKDGKSDGFKLVGIRPGSLYSYIGIRSGDVLKRVNGEELNNPSKALALFEKLRSSSNIVVDVERRGTNVSLTYNIK